jgi:hypothetical protein
VAAADLPVGIAASKATFSSLGIEALCTRTAIEFEITDIGASLKNKLLATIFVME